MHLLSNYSQKLKRANVCFFLLQLLMRHCNSLALYRPRREFTRSLQIRGGADRERSQGCMSPMGNMHPRSSPSAEQVRRQRNCTSEQAVDSLGGPTSHDISPNSDEEHHEMLPDVDMDAGWLRRERATIWLRLPFCKVNKRHMQTSHYSAISPEIVGHTRRTQLPLHKPGTQ